ncbi:MAG TPA: gluconate 2-dehydrogenase subunit 3 family protein [Beijerinckiaceae bacterium]|jgi:gluconate 2-dehydrogenase gamma chain|nr:gluconate 2-dehydrogenase subunit 3 family protein [Beijerinckiaceae bacterium]
MSRHDQARRAFLIQTATGVGAAAATGLLPGAEAEAQTASKNPPAATTMSTAKPEAPKKAGEGSGAFFNMTDSITIAAIAERIMPGAPGKPGATEAGVFNYIDLALAGAYADQQEFYRHGLTQLEAYCNATYQKSFSGLPTAQQDEVLTALEAGKATGFDWPHAQPFFNTLRKHTMEGMFADPVYGGNQNFVGWRLVGFPGAQQQFTPDDLASKDQFTREPIIGMQS